MIAVLIILAVLTVLALLPVGAVCLYNGETVIRLQIGPGKLQLVPAKPKTPKQRQKAEEKAARKKAEKEEKKQEAAAKKLRKEPEQTSPKSLRERVEELVPFARLAVQLLGTLRRKLLILELTVRVTVAGSDAAKTARICGEAWAAIGAMQPVLLRAFRIGKTDLQVTPDFIGTKTTVYACIRLRFFLGDLVAMAVKYAVKALVLLLRQKKSEKTRKAVQV